MREQLFTQIAFLISTEQWPADQQLPSVRALARKLQIHHNTVSQAYQDLVDSGYLMRRRGSRMVVRSLDRTASAQDLDDLINETLRTARARGFTLQQLTRRVRERLLEQPASHILALSPDAGMRALLEFEIRAAMPFPVRSCSPAELIAQPALGLDALVLVPPAFLPDVTPVLPKSRPAVPILYSPAAPHLKAVQTLKTPTRIVIVSISALFIDAARALLSTVIQEPHSLTDRLVAPGEPVSSEPGELLVVDAAACGSLKGAPIKTAHVYRVISPETLAHIQYLMTP